jgi:DNA-binding transcriptional ArsR family regulator
MLELRRNWSRSFALRPEAKFLHCSDRREPLGGDPFLNDDRPTLLHSHRHDERGPAVGVPATVQELPLHRRHLTRAGRPKPLTCDRKVSYCWVMDGDDLVFRALADPVRRLLLDALFQRDGRSLGELEAAVNQHVEMTRFGVAKHLRLLEQADLVISRKQGRAKLHHLNPVPIQQIHQRWIGKYTERVGVAALLLDLKHHLETPEALETLTIPEDDTP